MFVAQNVTVGKIIDFVYIGLCGAIVLMNVMLYLGGGFGMAILSVPVYFLVGLLSLTWFPFRMFTKLVSGAPKKFLVAAFLVVALSLCVQFLVPAVLLRYY